MMVDEFGESKVTVKKAELLEAILVDPYGHSKSGDVAGRPPYTGRLYSADPDCEHEVVGQWSGVKCSKCPGWFCL